MNTKQKNSTRLLFIIASALMIVVLFLPIWRIELNAPQYPEGLALTIHANGLKGDVDIINGLNHYIGMKTLHNEDFFEFTLLPYLIGFFSILFLLAGLINKRIFTYSSFVLFLIFGMLSMYDFWRWEYDYGRNLDQNAAIKVPGMAYQPPLIGFKQLLNFGAYSVPDIGGWLFIISGLLVLTAVILEYYTFKKRDITKVISLITLSCLFSSCEVAVEPIQKGIDQCYSCKMKISDERFATALLTEKGKTYKFDDAICLKNFLKENSEPRLEIKKIYLVNYLSPQEFIPSEKAYLLKSSSLGSPMGGNVAAFNNINSLNSVLETHKGESITWKEFIK